MASRAIRVSIGLCLTLMLLPAPAAFADDAGDTQEDPRAAAQDRAVRILVEASMGEDPALRSNAIEAMQVLPSRARPVAGRALDDPNPGVRFAAVVTAGILRFDDLIPAIEPLLDDDHPAVRAAARYALHTLGQRVDLTPLADMLTGSDPRLRSNVALLLGLLGDESAAPMLRHAATVPMPRAGAAQVALVRIQIAEAIGRLGDDAALDALRAGAFSQFDEVRVVAVTAMGAIGDQRMEVALERLLADPPVELQLAAAGSLARLGNPGGLRVAFRHAEHENPVVRAQVAWVLGWFDDDYSFEQAERMMQDDERIVRVSAAASVLRRTATGHRGAGG